MTPEQQYQQRQSKRYAIMGMLENEVAEMERTMRENPRISKNIINKILWGKDWEYYK